MCINMEKLQQTWPNFYFVIVVETTCCGTTFLYLHSVYIGKVWGKNPTQNPLIKASKCVCVFTNWSHISKWLGPLFWSMFIILKYLNNKYFKIYILNYSDTVDYDVKGNSLRQLINNKVLFVI